MTTFIFFSKGPLLKRQSRNIQAKQHLPSRSRKQAVMEGFKRTSRSRRYENDVRNARKTTLGAMNFLLPSKHFLRIAPFRHLVESLGSVQGRWARARRSLDPRITFHTGETPEGAIDAFPSRGNIPCLGPVRICAQPAPFVARLWVRLTSGCCRRPHNAATSE